MNQREQNVDEMRAADPADNDTNMTAPSMAFVQAAGGPSLCLLDAIIGILTRDKINRDVTVVATGPTRWTENR
jgi:hypothetical protein